MVINLPVRGTSSSCWRNSASETGLQHGVSLLRYAGAILRFRQSGLKITVRQWLTKICQCLMKFQLFFFFAFQCKCLTHYIIPCCSKYCSWQRVRLAGLLIKRYCNMIFVLSDQNGNSSRTHVLSRKEYYLQPSRQWRFAKNGTCSSNCFTFTCYMWSGELWWRH